MTMTMANRWIRILIRLPKHNRNFYKILRKMAAFLGYKTFTMGH